MNKEGLTNSPALENQESEESLYSDLSTIHAFVSSAKSLELHSSNISHFAMSQKYKRKTECRLRLLKKELGITARRGTVEFNEIVSAYDAQLEEERYPSFWFGSEPRPLNTSGEQIVLKNQNIDEEGE